MTVRQPRSTAVKEGDHPVPGRRGREVGWVHYIILTEGIPHVSEEPAFGRPQRRSERCGCRWHSARRAGGWPVRPTTRLLNAFAAPDGYSCGPPRCPHSRWDSRPGGLCGHAAVRHGSAGSRAVASSPHRFGLRVVAGFPTPRAPRRHRPRTAGPSWRPPTRAPARGDHQTAGRPLGVRAHGHGRSPGSARPWERGR